MKHPFFKSLLLSFISSLILVLSFPRCDLGFLAWVALVPLFFALDGKRKGQAFLIGYCAGVLFFAGTLYWFIHVTMLGAILIVLYMGVYSALFALGYSLFGKKGALEKLFLLPCLWVTLEFIRGHLLTGFGWASLGYSQYQNLPFIQIADVTGMYGVSFLVVMGNVLIKEILQKKLSGLPLSDKSTFRLGATAACIFLLALCYGMFRLSERQAAGKIKIAIVQANTPQEIKWDSRAWPSIMEKYMALTRQAAQENPSLIIWPETAFPGFIWEAPELFIKLKDFVDVLNIPLLLGVVTQPAEDMYYNSAILISSDGDVVEQYNKRHLVPFGEYIPLRKFLPFLSTIVPIGDFTPGETYTLFPLPVTGRSNLPEAFFSALICFEDTVPELSRGFVKQGANLLVNLTNNAWFQDTAAPFLHMQAAVLRAVENRVSLVRSTNTGVSCFIDKRGRVIKYLENDTHKRSYVTGYALEDVPVYEGGTFYTKYGDVFTYLCFGGILGSIIRRRRR